MSRAMRLAVGVGAVGARELRGRMRGRRAFAIVTAYLLLLSAIAFGIDAYLRQRAALSDLTAFASEGDLTLSADVGHGIFSGLLVVLTLLVLLLAPAFTAGAISMEREKQTLDLLVATPLSTLGLVVGKLLSALAWVFLLILASVPLMAIVVVFGGVGPEDLMRAYLVLLSMAFGMGAVGLFASALTRRTQTATVITLLVILALTLGSAAVHEFWKVVATPGPDAKRSGFLPVGRSDPAPQALLWLNPFVADADLICTTAPGGRDPDTCDYLAEVTGTPWFSVPDATGCDGLRCREKGDALGREVALQAANVGAAGAVLGAAPPLAGDDAATLDEPPLASFGFPRDTFWPRSAAAFLVVGVLLTLASTQLVAPSRRIRLRRRSGSGGRTAPTAPVGGEAGDPGHPGVAP